jgi:CspA family cold shock protein
MTGSVKWFSNARGYGFILPDAGGRELFAHYTSIEMDGFRTLRQGQRVEFECREGPKGPLAASIRPLS